MSDYGPAWVQLRERVFRRDGYRCASCGRRGGPHGDAVLHAHHTVPRSEGGADDVSNLVTLCGSCHGSKHDNGNLKSRTRRRAGAPRRRSRARRQSRRVGRGRY